MQRKTVADVQANLPLLLLQLSPGEELAIIYEGKTIARLKRERNPSGKPREPGSAASRKHWMADDFDAPLEDFREYSE